MLINLREKKWVRERSIQLQRIKTFKSYSLNTGTSEKMVDLVKRFKLFMLAPPLPQPQKGTRAFFLFMFFSRDYERHSFRSERMLETG